MGVNPLCPKNDQHQFSPNRIHTSSKEKAMRSNIMITKGKMLWPFIKINISTSSLKKCIGALEIAMYIIC